mgnify:CR=1 FL=1
MPNRSFFIFLCNFEPNKLFVYEALIVASFHRGAVHIIRSALQRFIRAASFLKSKSLPIRDPPFDMRRMTRPIIKILMNIISLIINISIGTPSVTVRGLDSEGFVFWMLR